VRLGILGGTFNPPHLGHLVCAQEAYVQLRLDRVLLVPTLIPPHKAMQDEPGPEHRLELCRLAARGDERLEVSAVELDRRGPSFTVDTLEQLTREAPERDLFLILGGDIAAGLPEWRDPERVLTLATVAVAERPGTPRHAVHEGLAEVDAGGRAQFFSMPTIDVSSTAIRERVRNRQPIRYLVPDPVESYIRERGLYAGGEER
jgi:nicotinate-nucleotide adenylyltransferase